MLQAVIQVSAEMLLRVDGFWKFERAPIGVVDAYTVDNVNDGE